MYLPEDRENTKHEVLLHSVHIPEVVVFRGRGGGALVGLCLLARRLGRRWWMNEWSHPFREGWRRGGREASWSKRPVLVPVLEGEAETVVAL